ncbi:MAG: hypothetical protein U5L45_15860 [Saprospiraceae bacterium]|nr:hypothetical protein [Saprospiraceae bacterium]
MATKGAMVCVPASSAAARGILGVAGIGRAKARPKAKAKAKAKRKTLRK